MSLLIVIIKKEMKDKKWIKTKIGLGSVVKAKDVEMENNTMEVRIRRMRENMVICLQDVVDKKKFPVQFEEGRRKRLDMFCFCMYV